MPPRAGCVKTRRRTIRPCSISGVAYAVTAVYLVAIPTDEAHNVFLVACRGLQIALGMLRSLLFATRPDHEDADRGC